MFTKKKSLVLASSCALAAGVLLANQSVRADIPYSNGFETPGSQNDFYGITAGGGYGSYVKGNNITRVASGTYGINASSGNYYAVVHNVDANYYEPGPPPVPTSSYGQAVYTAYNSSGGADQNPAPNGFFTESTAVYVNLTPSTYGYWAPPTNPNVPAFYIDSTPAGTVSDPNAVPVDFNDEINFRISVPTAGTVSVGGYGASGSGHVASITQTGWYTFLMTFATGSSGYVQNTLSVLNSSNAVLGSVTVQSNNMLNSYLGGTGYGDWFTIWQNGFAGDNIAIDDVATTPEPGPLALLGLGALALLLRKRKKATSAL